MSVLGASAKAQDVSGTTVPVTAIQVDGNTAFSDADVRRVVPLKVGDPFELPQAELSRRLLQSHYENHGYLEARVTDDSRLWSSSATLAFRVDEGPLYRFGPTQVSGLQGLSELVIRRELAYREGDPFRRRALFDTQGRIYGLGLFDDIDVQTSTEADKMIGVRILVKERPLQWFRGGVGYGSEERERLSLSYLDHNFLKRAYKAEVSGLYSHIWLEFRAEMVNRYLFGTRTEHRSHASWRREHREGYDLERVLGQVGLGRALIPNLSLASGYRLQRTLVFNVDPGVSRATPEKSLTSAVDASLRWDDTDDFFFPSDGTRVGLTAERSGGFLGGDIHFNRFSWNAAVYEPLPWSLLAVAVIRSGFVEAFPPSEDVPIFERFFLGGANSVRGYSERRLGPTNPEGNPVGGNVVLSSTAELRFPVYRRFSGAVFWDGGQVGPRPRDVEPWRWKTSAGAGVRFRTPVGPFRLDYGYKLNPDPDDRNLWSLHFSIGEPI
jgi:outer membrane protein assembly complex protein YaeT